MSSTTLLAMAACAAYFSTSRPPPRGGRSGRPVRPSSATPWSRPSPRARPRGREIVHQVLALAARRFDLCASSPGPSRAPSTGERPHPCKARSAERNELPFGMLLVDHSPDERPIASEAPARGPAAGAAPSPRRAGPGRRHRERSLSQQIHDRRGIVSPLGHDRLGREPERDGHGRVRSVTCRFYPGEGGRRVPCRGGDDHDGAGRQHRVPRDKVEKADVVGVEQGQVEEPGRVAQSGKGRCWSRSLGTRDRAGRRAGA